MKKEMLEMAKAIGLMAEPYTGPGCEQHTPDQPTGYREWHAWADLMSKTHKQKRCTFCGLFAVWVPRS